MQLRNNATPEQLIEYSEKLAGGNYGEIVSIRCSGDTITLLDSDDTLVGRKVCGYVAHILGIGLTDFPGCSEKDQHRPHKITPQKIKEFKNRTAYLLPKTEALKTHRKPRNTLVAA